MNTLMNTLKQVLNALPSSYAGEMLSLQEKRRYLLGDGTFNTQAVQEESAREDEVPGIQATRRKQVALWLTELPTRAVLDYTLSACQRMSMDLLILHAGKPRAQDILAAFGEELENANVAVDIHNIEDAITKTLYRYIEETPRIAFLVMGNSEGDLETAGHTHPLPPVPVVVLANATAAVSQEESVRAIAA